MSCTLRLDAKHRLHVCPESELDGTARRIVRLQIEDSCYCTIEAVTPLLEKVIDGFGELFRMKSYDEIGTASMLSRAVAGIYQQRAVFCIPGSTAAVKLATTQLIVPEIVHILSHATK